MFPKENIRIHGKQNLSVSLETIHYLCIVSCLFVCFTLGGGTNTADALQVTQYNVLEPALANPLGDVETVQVIFYRRSFMHSSVCSFVLSFVEFFILHLAVRQTGHSAIYF